MPHLGPVELAVILVAVIMILGVRRLPELGSALGKGIRGFREAAQEPGDGSPAQPAEPDTL